MVLSLKFINKIYRIVKNFNINGEISDITPITNGNINTTYLVEAGGKSYIVQSVNTEVFKNPLHIMENIKNVTAHIKSKIIISGGDPERGTLNFLRGTDGMNFYVEESEFWRVCPFIVNTTSHSRVKNFKILRSAARGFGNFQNQLADFPMKRLHETIPNFHNTKKRLDDFFKAVEKDAVNRADSVRNDIKFFEERYETAGKFTAMLENNEMPLRVTHNDTKCNNILIDNDTYEAVCVIDLDTVMPGLAVYDFGDAVRFAANKAAEDERNLDKVEFDLKAFEAFASGFIGALEDSLTDTEIENMAQGCINITVELASRFLADHIDGDRYFKTRRSNHNLERARNQMKLASEMEKNLKKMNSIVFKYKK